MTPRQQDLQEDDRGAMYKWHKCANSAQNFGITNRSHATGHPGKVVLQSENIGTIDASVALR